MAQLETPVGQHARKRQRQQDIQCTAERKRQRQATLNRLPFQDLKGSQRLDRGKRIAQLAISDSPYDGSLAAREQFSLLELFIGGVSRKHALRGSALPDSNRILSGTKNFLTTVDERHSPLATYLPRYILSALVLISAGSSGVCSSCGKATESLLTYNSGFQCCTLCVWGVVKKSMKIGGPTGGPYAWLKSWWGFRSRVFETTGQDKCPMCTPCANTSAWTIDVSGEQRCPFDTTAIVEKEQDPLQIPTFYDHPKIVELAERADEPIQERCTQQEGGQCVDATSSNNHDMQTHDNPENNSNLSANSHDERWDTLWELSDILHYAQEALQRIYDTIDKHPEWRLTLHRALSAPETTLRLSCHSACGMLGHDRGSSCMFFHDPLGRYKPAQAIESLRFQSDKHLQFVANAAVFMRQMHNALLARMHCDPSTLLYPESLMDRNIFDLAGIDDGRSFLYEHQTSQANAPLKTTASAKRFNSSSEGKRVSAKGNWIRNYSQYNNASVWHTAWFGIPLRYMYDLLLEDTLRPCEVLDMASWTSLSEMEQIKSAWASQGFKVGDLESYQNHATFKREYITDDEPLSFLDCMDTFWRRIESASASHSRTMKDTVNILCAHRNLFFDAFIKQVYTGIREDYVPSFERIKCNILSSRADIRNFDPLSLEKKRIGSGRTRETTAPSPQPQHSPRHSAAPECRPFMDVTTPEERRAPRIAIYPPEPSPSPSRSKVAFEQTRNSWHYVLQNPDTSRLPVQQDFPSRQFRIEEVEEGEGEQEMDEKGYGQEQAAEFFDSRSLLNLDEMEKRSSISTI